jgi:hypothetical protein
MAHTEHRQGFPRLIRDAGRLWVASFPVSRFSVRRFGMACHHHDPPPVRSIAEVVGFLHTAGFRRHPSGELPRFVRDGLEIEIGHVLTVVQFKQSPADGQPPIHVADWVLMLTLDNPLPLLRLVVEHARTSGSVRAGRDASRAGTGVDR